MRKPQAIRNALALLLACAAPASVATTFTQAQLDYFETRVRPVLAEHCYACHGAEKQKAGLRVDHRAGLLTGGDNGPSLVPGNPEASRLLHVIRYDDVTLQMPPRGMLPATDIQAIQRWIADGAAWPEEAIPTAGKQSEADHFDLNARRAAHWAWQPIQTHTPPPVRDAAWPRGAIDQFLLARLEAEGLRPAPPAEPATLLRRLTYDLTGLPPTPEEVAAYLADTAPDAYEKQVDRLLASPRFGEAWGRHWLDLVRFAETYGFELDFTIQHAWQYRDYVIRALNADLPYDDFVREHLAGDLLETPRKHPEEGYNESIIATGFWFFHQAQHAPVDVRLDLAERVDNQIDVMSKALLGITVACARCHDHKFDAVSAADYYALAGMLKSSRYQVAYLDPGNRVEQIARLLGETHGGGEAPEVPEAPAKPQPIEGRFEDFSQGFGGWRATGFAFGDAPSGAADWMPTEAGPRAIPAGVAHSGRLDARLQGVLRSPTFTLDKPAIRFLAAGRNATIRLVIEGYTLREFVPLLFESAEIKVEHGDEYQWLEMHGSLVNHLGCQAHLEFSDEGNGYLAIDSIYFADGPLAETAGPAPGGDTAAAVARWRGGSATPADAAAINRALDEKRHPLGPDGLRLVAAQARMGEIAAPLGQMPRCVAMCEGDGRDDPLQVRGSPRNLGEAVPRRFLEALSGPEQPPIREGSGRRELADRLLAPENPLPARVMVNRVWHHLFGQGIVATVDNFGLLGTVPTHPELLDFLAAGFQADGWSVKRLVRSMVTSSAYRMRSAPADPAAETRDPANTLLHRMPLRRLPAEAIRDSLLAVSGQLELASVGGPSVPSYISPFMGGHRKPEVSGPMDGARRRSIYLEVRRNFLLPLLQTFDFPAPDSTHGRRNQSNVPAQSLVLLNDPFVLAQAQAWGDAIASQDEVPSEDRIVAIYQRAFGRAPSEEESARALAFLAAEARAAGQEGDQPGPAAWAALCQVIFTLKEFIFLG